jgi:hypothetical protein
MIIAFLLLLLFITGLLNAVMDIADSDVEFNSSIFAKYKNKFFDIRVNTYKNKYDEQGLRKRFLGIKIPVLFVDLWHLAKSACLFVLFICIAILSFWSISINFFIAFFIFRFAFGFGFWLTYNYLFVKHGFYFLLTDIELFFRFKK